MTRKTYTAVANTGTYLALTVICVLLVLPLVWMVSTSLKPSDEIFTRVPHWIPRRPTLHNYGYMLFHTEYGVYFMNSFKVSVVTTACALILSVFSGYSLSRFRFRGRSLIGTLVIAVQMFPYVLLVVPLFIIMRSLHLIDTLWSLIIAYGTLALPFSIWMLKGYFDTIPISLEEAAIIDGCRRIQVVFRIVLPLSAPGIVAVSMFAFILAWREYIYALTFTRSDNMRLVTVGLAIMQGVQGRVSWGQIMSGAVMACIPAIVVFIVLQRYMVQGFTRGAVKE